ncbi:MAG: hypothetical protein WAP23_01160 [Candidatus Spechtbacterales bacterium]
MYVGDCGSGLSEAQQGAREETFTASLQAAQTLIEKLQILKVLPVRSWSERKGDPTETVYARDHYADRRSSAVLKEQGHWVGRRRRITFVWNSSEMADQISCAIRLEQGFHDPNFAPDDPELARQWVPAHIIIEGSKPGGEQVRLCIYDHTVIKALCTLAEGKPLFV